MKITIFNSQNPFWESKYVLSLVHFGSKPFKPQIQRNSRPYESGLGLGVCWFPLIRPSPFPIMRPCPWHGAPCKLPEAPCRLRCVSRHEGVMVLASLKLTFFAPENRPGLLGQWLNFSNFLGIYMTFSRENKPFKLAFFSGSIG